MSLKLTSYKGTRDLYPADMLVRNHIFSGWRYVVESYGYQEYMAPLLEPQELYAAKSGAEIVNEQTYSFTDRGNRQMVIRPEMTPSIARMVAARRQETPLPARYYSIANFMRYERPQHGREREFWQLNFDLFGVDNIAADLEIVNLSYDLIRYFGADETMFTIRLNDRRLTDFIMTQYLGLDAAQSGQMIKLLDRYDKISPEDFAEQATEVIGATKLEQLQPIIAATGLDDLPDEIAHNEVTKPLRQVLDRLHQRGIGNAVYSVRLMRGFDYYTGIVFEVFDEAPANKRAMFGGGRYDGLVSLFDVESLPVVGAAPGETTFYEFLTAHNLIPDLTIGLGPDVMVMPTDESDELMDKSAQLATQLRNEGLEVAVDYTSRKLDKRIKAAVKQNAQWLLFVGEQEVTEGKYGLKEVATGEQVELPADQLGEHIHNQTLERCRQAVSRIENKEEE